MKTPLSSYRWDWPLTGLMIVLIYTAAARLALTDWTPDLWIVNSLAILGMILGLLLGVSSFRKAPLRWLVAGYSLMTIPWFLLGLISAEETILGRLASLGGRLGVSLSMLTQNQKVTETLFFITLMCLLFWFIGIYSGFHALGSQRLLAIILPATIPLLVVQYYDGYKIQRMWTVGFYFFIVMLIVGRLGILTNREHWKEKRVFAGADPEFDITRGLALAAAVIILLAWSVPTPAAAVPTIARVWQQVNKPLETTRKRLDDVLAALRGNTGITTGELYGQTMGLGQSAGQGPAEIFTVKPSEFNPVRVYWRVRVYDFYENGRWTTSSSKNVTFSPGTDSIVDPAWPAGQPTEFIFDWKTNRTALLVTPGFPLWTSRTGSYQINPLNQDFLDLLSWSVAPPVERGDQYRVQAVVLNPTIKALNEAGENYPPGVKSHYLSLPANLSQEIQRLSRELTAGKTTPYDKSIAITNYLRNEIEYSLTIPAPPPGVDPMDWFLFTWKSGFCNYYATAEVLMLRAAGIPARMVVGYAPGEYQTNGTYKISAKDAHAWPEVYFPGIGWVEFEPTTSQDSIIRPSGETTPLAGDEAIPSPDERFGQALNPDGGPDFGRNQPDEAGDGTSGGMFLGQSVWLWVIIFIVGPVLAVIELLVWWIKHQPTFRLRIPQTVKALYVRYHLNVPAWLERWVRWSEVTVVERAFHAINQSLQWLGNPPAQDLTAAERAMTLKTLVPAAATEIERLAIAHEKTLYTPEPADSTVAARAAWRIRYHALRALVSRWLNGE